MSTSLICDVPRCLLKLVHFVVKTGSVVKLFGNNNALIAEKKKEQFIPKTTDQQSVEAVSSFMYLGTVVDSNLSFSDNGVYVYKKAQQRLYLLGKLRSF